ncbi:hypothetical protein [Salinicoccus sp. CNSTN-B1]
MTTRSSLEDAVTNNLARKQFEEWYEFNNRPNLKLIAKDMGIAYTSLISWRKGNREFGYGSLVRIEKYFKKLVDRQEKNLELMKNLIE